MVEPFKVLFDYPVTKSEDEARIAATVFASKVHGSIVYDGKTDDEIFWLHIILANVTEERLKSVANEIMGRWPYCDIGWFIKDE
jgi:hypothetical protein